MVLKLRTYAPQKSPKETGKSRSCTGTSCTRKCPEEAGKSLLGYRGLVALGFSFAMLECCDNIANSGSEYWEPPKISNKTQLRVLL